MRTYKEIVKNYILIYNKPKKSTATAFKVKPAIYKKYFTASISQKEFDSIVDEALALYFAQKGQESEQEAG